MLLEAYMFWFDKNSKLVAVALLVVFMLAGCGGAEASSQPLGCSIASSSLLMLFGFLFIMIDGSPFSFRVDFCNKSGKYI